MKEKRRIISLIIIGLTLASFIAMVVLLIIGNFQGFAIASGCLFFCFLLSWAFLRSVKGAKDVADDLKAPKDDASDASVSEAAESTEK